LGKNVRKLQGGGFFLTHTVYVSTNMLRHKHDIKVVGKCKNGQSASAYTIYSRRNSWR